MMNLVASERDLGRSAGYLTFSMMTVAGGFSSKETTGERSLRRRGGLCTLESDGWRVRRSSHV